MFGDKKLLRRLERMLEDGINGTFEESDYDESQLSKLETKWLRYMTVSRLSAKKTEEERKKLRELVSDISHQTRTPLANILLYTQLLQEHELDGETRGISEEIRKQAEKLEFLIQSLVKTSRLETGTFSFSAKEGDLCTAAAAAIEQVRPAAVRKSISVISPESPCNAVFDIKWTTEALFNILDNAVKYSPEGSRITVSASAFELFSCISVFDEGMGIPEDEQPLIFGRFSRGSGAMELDGVGIGLYLSRRIIEGQGGYISVSSEVGKGSVFKVFLPRS